MADIFEIVGKVSLNGLDKAEKDLRGFSDTGEQSASKLSKLGGIAKTVGKGILIGTGAVVTAGVGLVKQVSASYGQLQQSIGGIETLFGDSAKKVIENANNAYTTAGISANEYMQQVTSFSASLLQSLGGDTEKACESADMAIRDMADNANKMGTSMEMIQNAYQGFSKQNYTMLDNLKLGYGGTKSEMERLLADAEKISGVKYDISNLNDVYSAIHIIQQELGITGTTALEAGATIEGSFNSLSASWENFIAGLGNPDADMKQLVDNLAKGLSGAVNNVTPIIDNMVAVLPTVMDALIGAVNDLAPKFIETFTTLITQVIDGIVKLLPAIIPAVVDMLNGVINTLVSNLPLIIDAVILLVNEVITALSDMLPELIPTIVQAVVDIANSLLNNLPILLDAVLNLVQGVAEGIISALPILVEALPTLITGIIDFFASSAPIIVDATVALLMAMIDAIPIFLEAFIPVLPELIFAIVDGIVKMNWAFADAGVTLFIGLLDSLKKIVTNCIEYAPKLVDSMVNELKQLPEKFKEIYDNAMGRSTEFFNKFLADGAKGATEFVEKFKEFMSNLPYNLGVLLGEASRKVADWAVNLFNKAKETGKNFVDGVIDFVKNLPENLHQILTDIVNKVISWSTNLVLKGKLCAINLSNAIVNGVKNLPKKMKTAGDNLVKGLWEGITGAGDWLKNKISGFCNSVIEGFKAGFDSHSPARKLIPIGNWVAQGLGVGITEDTSAEQAIDNKVNDIISTANNMRMGVGIDGLIGESPMQKYQLDFNAQIGALNDGFERLIVLVGNYLPNISDNMNRPIAVDGNNLAMAMGKQMDNQLGRMAIAKGRGNV